jgi:hypothetical protein
MKVWKKLRYAPLDLEEMKKDEIKRINIIEALIKDIEHDMELRNQVEEETAKVIWKRLFSYISKKESIKKETKNLRRN